MNYIKIAPIPVTHIGWGATEQLINPSC